MHGYIRGYFETIPFIKPLLVRDTDDVIELANGVDIVVATNSFRAIRGRTIVCAIFDEVAFWFDERTARPDVETYSAVVPGLARVPGSLLIGISTPYRRSGTLFPLRQILRQGWRCAGGERCPVQPRLPATNRR